MIKPAIPLTPKALFVFALLIILGFLGNYWSLPLFFGVDFILGSIPVLIVVYFYGLGLGVLAALIVSSYTYFLWGHPYTMIIFSLEALFVGFLLRPGRGSLLLLDALYWLLIGMPVVWLCYSIVMHMDGISALLIMLKQVVNGISNALLASLAITYLPFQRILKPGPDRQTISLQETLLNLLVALILAPALFIMLLNSRGVMMEMQEETLGQMERVGADISGQLSIWNQRNLEAVTELAALAAKYPLQPSPALQHDTELIHKALLNFQVMYVANAQGIAIAVSPAVNKKGQNTVGMNFADQPYFKEMQTTRRPVVSEVFVGLAASFSPVVSLSVPILKGDQFSGYALGSINLERIQEMLVPYGKLRQMSVTLVDPQGRVIASTVPDRKPMAPGKRQGVGTVQPIRASVYQWFSGDEKMPQMTRWKNSYYVQETAVAHLPWKLILEAPLAPLQKRLYTIYVYNLGIMTGLTALALIMALIFSRWLARPLTGLAQVTSNLPEKLLAHQDILWPESSAAEIHSLVGNFQDMARTLEGNVQELQERSTLLAKANQGLEEEIAARVRMEEALTESETKYRTLVEEVDLGITLISSDYKIIMTNAAQGKIFGKLPQEFVGKYCFQEFEKRDGICPHCPGAKTMASGEPMEVDTIGVHDDGTFHYAHVRTFPTFDSLGKVTGFIKVVEDTMARRLAEEALEEERRQKEAILNNIPDLAWLKDKQGQYLSVNAPFAKTCGVSPQEMVGKSDLDIWPLDLAQKYRADDQEVIRTGNRKCFEEPLKDTEKGMIWIETIKTPILNAGHEVIGTTGISRDITSRKQMEETLKGTNARLQIMVNEAEDRNRNMALLNDMSDMLQSCQTSEEAFAAINHFVPQFFPTDAGALYLLRDSKNLLSSATTWGDVPPSEEFSAPDDCWAVRSGRMHWVDDPASALLCKHITAADPRVMGYLCVPLMAQGVSLGILHIRFLSCPTWERQAEDLAAKQRLAVAIAENLSLALANLKLREILQKQAIRDPLTGLYNRRYLEETMDRELHRSRRLKAPLGVVMMDLDHFKDFNDSFGHGAEDAMLNALAQVITAGIRAEDIACRYGGEEFLLVMPGSSLETTRERAESIRQAVQALQVKYQDRFLKSTTISLGVAIFPDHGVTAEEVIAAADAALYRAKKAGRDRVEIARPNSPAAAAP